MPTATPFQVGSAPLGDAGGTGWGANFNQGNTPPVVSPGGAGGATPTGPAAPGNLLPTIQQLLSFMPQMFQAFGGVPTVSPSMIDPSTIGSYLTPYMQSVDQSLAPQFAQQTDALNTDLASRGIYNSSAGSELQGRLSSQQLATALGQSLPMAQQDVMANQGSQNAADFANAQAYGNVVQSNEGMYNNFLQQLMGAGMGITNANIGSYLGSFGANPAALGLLNTGLQGAGSAYSSAYNNNMGWIQQLMQSLGTVGAAAAGA